MTDDDTKTTEIQLVEADSVHTDVLPEEGETLEVGQWFWVEDEDGRWLGCLTHLGSNFAEITQAGARWASSVRIHLDAFDCERELDPEGYIKGKVEHYRQKTQTLMGKVHELTARLGVAKSPELEATASTETHAMTVVNSNEQIDGYKADLIKAKEETLPDLFKRIEESNEKMAFWMKAQTIPMEAQAKHLKGSLGLIQNRIHSVELYAGLTEEVVQFAEGEPAELGTKIHLLQRRHYMDEECLARYKTGGMEFTDIDDFERWLAEPENRDRLLPFKRCVVAFRVRRFPKKRALTDYISFFEALQKRRADEMTFLYLRNGENLYCLRTSIEFNAKLFPDLERSRLTGRLWATRDASGRRGILTDDQYQGLLEDEERKIAEWEAEKKQAEEEYERRKADAIAKGEDLKKVHKPWPGIPPHKDSEDYDIYNKDNVYYDDITEVIQETIREHNRLVLVLQGLLDRSMVFHPHPPWQLWSDAGFTSALELVYDDDRALPPAELPDFEAYRKQLNKSLKVGDVCVGQQDAWLLYEGEKESRRRDNDYRYRGEYRPERYQPYGNPGPGMLAKVVKVTRTGKVTFAWMRERQVQRYDRDDEIRTTFTCPKKVLLNVSAYKPGDFHTFFDDPRTRADYLKWAPMLLEAEEYHAGNREVPDPPQEKKKPGSSHEGRRRYQMRKRRKALMNKIVRLTKPLETTGGDQYEIGSLWKVLDGRGDEFKLMQCDEKGDKVEDWSFVRNVPYYYFEIAEDLAQPDDDE